jgi:hypothetical protein
VQEGSSNWGTLSLYKNTIKTWKSTNQTSFRYSFMRLECHNFARLPARREAEGRQKVQFSATATFLQAAQFIQQEKK